jgi:phage terminase large subunit
MLYQAPRKLGFFFGNRFPSRYKVAEGGRGGGKSWTVADALILRTMNERLRILCAREFQRSIAESVHYLLASQIERFGYGPWFDVQKTTIVNKRTGAHFIFGGLKHNISALKSAEDIDICWVEEAQTVSEESWKILIPTIRKSGSEIWITFNPDQESDPTYQRFVVNTPPRCLRAKVCWWDNPHLPEELREEAEYMRVNDPEGYAHVWAGEVWQRSDAQVFNGKWCLADFNPTTQSKTPSENWAGPYYGADWGFSTDPTALMRFWIYGKKLYVEHEAFQLGCDTDKLPILFDKVPDSRKYTIRADNSRPETISYMKRAGFRCEAAEKWSGSVEDGISWLRGFERIIIHPNCKNFAQEARLYRYKVDPRTGDILPALRKGNDHGWDAIRYGAQPMIRKRTAPQRFSEEDVSRFI